MRISGHSKDNGIPGRPTSIMDGHDINDPMPVWIDNDTEIDPTWIQAKISPMLLPGIVVQKCRVQDISNQSRKRDEVKECATLRLTVICTNMEDEASTAAVPPPQSLRLVMKQIPSSGQALSQQLGLAREAFFYSQLAPKLNAIEPTASLQSSTDQQHVVPKIYYSWGDLATGSKVVIMEDLSADSYIDSGILFGPGNPNNWSRDLPKLLRQAYQTTPPPSSYQVAHVTFQAIAQVHATFWKDIELLQPKNNGWLRGCAWLQGQDKASWEASQQLIQGWWDQTSKLEKESQVPRLKWDPVVQKTVIHAVKAISWEAQLQRLNRNTHWTLVHGDFWPGNIMLHVGSTTESLPQQKLLDWEMVGVGSGPQELGQYMVSNMNPQERRECEFKLVQDYYNALLRLGVKDFSWDDCWKEYRIGGVERWLWFLIYFCGQTNGPMAEWAQFFHDQIAAFMNDHQLGPSDIVQPRP